MSTQIFITLPVVNLPRALAFYEAIGYSRNAEFTIDTAACLINSEHIHLMLLTHAKFGEFPPKAICDTSKALQVLHSLTCESRARVDELVRKAIAAGGSTIEEPQDCGFMYHHKAILPERNGVR